MDTLSIESLKADISFTGDVFIDSTFMLLPKSAILTEEMLKILKKWNFENILCDGNLSLGEQLELQSDDSDNSPRAPKEKLSETVKKIIEESKGESLINNDQARLEMVKNVYREYLNYIDSMYTRYVTHKEIDQQELTESVKDLCIFIKDHRRFILRVNSNYNDRNKVFLVTHSMRSTVLAIAIGMQLHLPLSKLIELGETCLLHEIGMVKLPPQLYMTDKKLSPFEKAKLSKHTVLGYTIVKDLNFPLSVQLGVLEHHENENGTGYPRRLSSEKISSNAKIIAVVCTYEAISSPRKYRDERSSFDALLELIQNREHKYDDTILKALLYTVSLYPIGTYVYLSNRKVAEVIDSNQDNPKCPVVQMLTETEKDGSPKIIQTNNEISILRILSKDEKRDIIKMLMKNVTENINVPDKPQPKEIKTEDDTGLEEITDEELSTINQNEVEELIEEVEEIKEEAPENPVENVIEESKEEVKDEAASENQDGIEEVDISIFS
ncbi:MAG: HD domain-containing protein [Treponema sp.]|nr:HD domain-containing protein [Treponema sp.]